MKALSFSIVLAAFLPAALALANSKPATPVKVTASSTQAGNEAWKAADGDPKTRWCAHGNSKPQWIQLELDKPQKLTGVSINWERSGEVYQRKIEVSRDGKIWELALDATSDTQKGKSVDEFEAEAVRFVRVTCTGTEGGWVSLWEIVLSGPEIGSILAKTPDPQQSDASGDLFAKGGNIPPKIVQLSPEEEAEIMKDVEVADGFEASLFSTWHSANYPVYVAASPSGDLYVSSDGNGSVGRDPDRGRVIRLRDSDRDGRADQLTQFIPNIDAPRGLIWDHDRLYVLHPPHISVFYDRDGDGVAEDSKKLIDGIAFGFDKRPPDHTTNGLELGIDGWIYIAGGDFGFMEATGTDGNKLQHRAGGVLRFRPDGSGLEIFATGTRNILATPMSPRLDLFARDNTNDGGGWDVRFHHFTGLEDHGYPRLYKNFPDEHVQPLADYGGGSGCGGVYIDEPGFPAEWNDAPFTCDWGKAGLFKHTVEPKGATFVEVETPEKFIKVTRPTDADVDGMSAVYQASWKGPATFRWAGAEQGYIVRVTPKEFKPEALPDFETLSDEELVKSLESESHVRRLTAQRAILRRSATDGLTASLVTLATDPRKPLDSRIAALFAISQRAATCLEADQAVVDNTQLWHDTNAAAIGPIVKIFEAEGMKPYALRALADLHSYFSLNHQDHAEVLKQGLLSDDLRIQREAIFAVTQQSAKQYTREIARLTGADDPVVAHTAFRALAKLNASEAAFGALVADGTSAEIGGASYALMRMRDPKVVSVATARLISAESPEIRRALISILCRLYHKEAEWSGDSWGTRPDTRGPYYQLTTWEESENILATLKDLLETSEPDELAFLVREMNRNRIQSDEALTKILDLAARDESVIPDAIAQMASSDSIPENGITLAAKAARNPESSATTLAQSIEVLSKTDYSEAFPAMLTGLVTLHSIAGDNKEHAKGCSAFLRAPKLENHHLEVEKLAFENLGSPENRWANAALLNLAERKKGSPESREMSQSALDTAWQNPEHKLVLMKLVSSKIVKTQLLNDRILAALSDSDPKVAAEAKKSADRLKLQLPGEDKTPKIASLKPEDAVEQATKAKGEIALGESVFQRATCVLCHTVSQDEAQKGPYLGSIAQTYDRGQLAEAIILPNKTIAQGFATNVLTLKSGAQVMGFVTDEAGDRVTVRDIAAQEHEFKKSEIANRETLPISMMPPGLMTNFSVHEVASLLDYLQALAK